MPKRKRPASQPKLRKKSRGPFLFRFIRFFLVPPGLLLTLIAAAAAAIYWKGNTVYQGFIRPVAGAIFDFGKATVGLFGFGLLLLLAAVIFLVWLSKNYRISVLLKRRNRWLAAIVILLIAWGILAFPGLGGRIGQGIISQANITGIIRLIALGIVAIVLIAPKLTFRLVSATFGMIGRAFAGLFRLLTRARAPAQTDAVKKIKVSHTAGPEVPQSEVALRSPQMRQNIPAIQPAVKKKKEPVPAAAKPARDTREVEEKVWKDGDNSVGVVVDGWRLPPVNELKPNVEVQFSDKDNQDRGRRIEEALASYGVEAKVVEINAGPTVTQFGLEPGWDRKFKEVKEKDKDGNVSIREDEISRTRVKVDRITSLANDLALALSAPSIRIEAPVPGKAIVGIEVPNTNTTNVTLRGVIETNAFQKVQAKAKLAIALGKGAGGETVAADLAKMPHLLIAGATGSGKTVCLNTIICCLLLTNTPHDVRFIMIDPKRVELTTFKGIPHLAMPVIVEPDKAVQALRGLSLEMKRRYEVLAAANKRNIESYNEKRQGKEKMPYLVLVIDELADLMMTGGDEVEQILCRLAQLSRAVGIHLVVATQRPSVDVVTGLIKANFPTRISFAVTSQVDSRTILDMVGAEKLLGRGDMLYMPTDASKPKRLQGCYVSDEEVERLVYLWGGQKTDEVLTAPSVRRQHPLREEHAPRNQGWTAPRRTTRVVLRSYERAVGFVQSKHGQSSVFIKRNA